jgi:hypothetical protein
MIVSALPVHWKMKIDEELWEEGNGFEEDGEGPGYFCEGMVVVEDESEDEGGSDEVLDTKCHNSKGPSVPIYFSICPSHSVLACFDY